MEHSQAALVIQSAFHNRKARIHAFSLLWNRQNAAARRIQAKVRSMLRVKHAQRELQRRKAERNSTAATIIQVKLAQYIARKRAKEELHRRRRQRAEDIREFEQQISRTRERAAIRIQTQTRIKIAKKRVARLRKERRLSLARRVRAVAARPTRAYNTTINTSQRRV